MKISQHLLMKTSSLVFKNSKLTHALLVACFYLCASSLSYAQHVEVPMKAQEMQVLEMEIPSHDNEEDQVTDYSNYATQGNNYTNEDMSTYNVEDDAQYQKALLEEKKQMAAQVEKQKALQKERITARKAQDKMDGLVKKRLEMASNSKKPQKQTKANLLKQRAERAAWVKANTVEPSLKEIATKRNNN